jgi:hypothetical protein
LFLLLGLLLLLPLLLLLLPFDLVLLFLLAPLLGFAQPLLAGLELFLVRCAPSVYLAVFLTPQLRLLLAPG